MFAPLTSFRVRSNPEPMHMISRGDPKLDLCPLFHADRRWIEFIFLRSDFDEATVKIHIAEPAADQIAYERIYTVINAESANTIQTVRATSAGKVVTLDLERHERFRLQPGKNVVEISAIDRAKQEYYASFVINAGATQAVKSARPVISAGSSQFGGRRYALVVGVSRYKFHEGGLNDLEYADADSRSIADFLKTRAGFKDADISYLENENATVENVRAAVDLFLDRARENDLVVLFVASH